MRKPYGNTLILTLSVAKRMSLTITRARLVALPILIALTTLSFLQLAPAGAAQTAESSGSLIIGRRSHTATQLADGRILIIGGENVNGPVGDSEIYDPSSRSFSLAARLNVPRAKHRATRLADGRVLVTGGRNQAGSLASTEIFDPATGSFTSGPSLNRARAGHSATVLADGRILITGGDAEGTAEVFDGQKFVLVEARMAKPRSEHSALRLSSGKVLIAGGSAADGTAVLAGEVFDPASMSFAATGNSMAQARTRPLLRELQDGRVQVIGGNNKKSMEIFVPASALYFTAKATLIPSSNPTSDILRTQTRAALFHKASTLADAPAGLLDREDHSITEIPQSNQALVGGGVDSYGNFLTSTSLLSSSPTTVTTDKVEYIPGERVTITGKGWQPGETVSIVLREDPRTGQDRTLTSVADANGDFTNTDLLLQKQDNEVAFIVTVKGQSSAFTAQTTFLDAKIKTRISLASIFRVYGTTTASLRAALNEETKTGLGGPVSGRQITFILNGIAVPGSFTTDVDGLAVTTPLNLADYGVVNAAAYPIQANFAGDDFYLKSSGTATFMMGKATPSISWPSPAAITYPEPIGATQLNATATNSINGASVAGTFAYTPAAGTVLEPGTHSLSVSFTPTDTLNYNSATAYNTLNVQKITPVIAWGNPADITYGTALGATQLNATASNNGATVDGTFTYTPAAGTVLGAGVNTLSVRFTPTDTAHYKTVTATVQINVLKATPAINWGAPADITYGTALGAAQLNATASHLGSAVDGTFTYSPAAGTVLQAGAGQTLSVSFAPADAANFNSASASVLINVTNRAPVADAQAVKTDEDTAKAITLTGSDADGNPITYQVVAGPANGTLTGTAPDLTYTPNANFNGTDSLTFKVSDTQADSEVATVSIIVNAVNDAPVADGQSAATDEDTVKAITLAASDLDGDPLTYSIVAGPANGSVSVAGSVVTYTPAANYNGPDSFTFKANDGGADSNVATVSIAVKAVNDAPSAAAGGPYAVNEGGSVVVTASGSDVEDTSLTFAWDLDNNGSFETAGQTVTFSASGLDGPSSPTVSVRVTDSGGLSTTAQATVNVANVAPVVSAINAPADPAQMGATINVSASFADAGAADTHTAVWSWGDGTTSPAVVSEANGSGSVSGSRTYTAAGLYTVGLTVTDKDGAFAQSIFQYVVVYDPARSESGKGSIYSPAGAYTRDPSLEGPADFSFSLGYGRNATTPSGRESFNFKTARASFTGGSYKWLVVNGARGWLRGTGTLTVNGVSETCEFLMTVTDGQQTGGGGIDRFRIKIWNATGVIYDNQTGAADDAEATQAVASSASTSVTIK